MCSDTLISNGLQESPVPFEVRFSRCRRLLHVVAYRVLGGAEGVEEVVQSCFEGASRNPRSFDNQGAFTSWLLRLLIDEALVIVQEKKEGSTTSLSAHEK
jgi:DNA-directed RNA polymerase specialized sigma24 family protein